MSSDILRAACAGLLLACLCVLGPSARAEPAAPDPWPDIADAAFHGRQLVDGTGLIAIEMPARAEDAALVPVTLRATLPPGDPRTVRSFTLVIDENPAPVAARFDIGPKAHVASLSTRVRVNSYTNVHAVAELSDGKAYVVKTYVKASGGCSAPAAKNPDQARAEIGQMKFRQFAPTETTAGKLREAQIMVRHPNNSGLQMDQLTRLYVPAFFVHSLRIWQGDDVVLSMEGGISISEDPNIRFSYAPNGATSFRAEAVDTDNHVYKGEWPVTASAM
ncbi:MAG TPA: quinoprotein dehydrogenase-associated SoxYZ-like carrier [Xanthobacteraceae bacterium]|nr:quinoprotein dehydrogenase-associated SoxYZ-like carrier [Xanthobacteraceae bacterium]